MQGITEADVDPAPLAGVQPAALLAEVVNEDGSVARLPDLERFARRTKQDELGHLPELAAG